MQTNLSSAGAGEVDLDVVRSRFGLLVAGIYRKWRRQVDHSFRDLGLSDATRTPLLALYAQPGGMRQKDLAEALSLDTSSLVRVLSQLRESRLVDWACDPADRRTKCIALTAEGRRIAAQILQRSLEIERALLADLDPQELAVTRAALEKISQRFEQLPPSDAQPEGRA
ncbi:MarR family winged helix-turn-helix transcriptional regulator [Caldimonas thermodepolymerans]|uniref:MarR family transcriptional regulator for hemolysin n=1 Tax=Caldimonas thermodepolymerans TaxID=215580 RepID=A0AA46DHH4_9BURK|nr:MarR family transcriptional regulator [Caldimonas thermodepolymerans]TCP09615.1 MarR family transcriptional regulator for hemolysin [Caldimonas thermodepolymerans]UZG49631.1 MarR family transcriptional regulator [Caldimonas thermodepolymerans]